MEEMKKLMDKYEEIFGDIFPTMCFQTDTDEGLKRKINQCINENKSARELFDIDDSNDY